MSSGFRGFPASSGRSHYPDQRQFGAVNNVPPLVEVQSRPSYRCSTCKLEFATYDETALHAQTHVQSRVDNAYPQHHQHQHKPQSAGTYSTRRRTTVTYPSSSSVPVSSSHTQQHQAKHYFPQGDVGSYSPDLPRTSNANYCGKSLRKTPQQGLSQAPTTVRSHTRRTKHPDGSETVTEETVWSDGTKTARTTRHPAPSAAQLPAPLPRPQQGYDKSLPQMAQSAHPSAEYEEFPMAEVSFAEPAPDGKPFW